MSTLQAQVEACKAALLAAAPGIVETQAQTALALVTLRIQSQGLGAYHYSPTPVPVFFFFNRALNSRGRDYVKRKEKEKGAARLGTWGEFRAAQGLPSDAVYLTYTGRMFRALTTQQGGQSGTTFTARIVAADQEAADKVRWNTERYGDFLSPNATEAAEVAQVGQEAANRIIQQFFPST